MQTAIRCLLIDDDPDDHEIFSMAITQAFPAAICFFAQNCLEAKRFLETGEVPAPDYLFMDWNLTQFTAGTCIQELNHLRALQYTSIVILSGSDPLLGEEELRLLGIKKVMKKQGSIDQMANDISAFIAAR